MFIVDFFIQKLDVIFAFQFYTFMSTLTQSTPVNSVESLRAALAAGPVTFNFVKKAKDAVRSALGTTCLTSIPADKHPKGTGRPAVKTVPFFDLKIQKWRSVSIESLVFGLS